jgi:hypothetical protein
MGDILLGEALPGLRRSATNVGVGFILLVFNALAVWNILFFPLTLPAHPVIMGM